MSPGSVTLGLVLASFWDSFEGSILWFGFWELDAVSVDGFEPPNLTTCFSGRHIDWPPLSPRSFVAQTSKLKVQGCFGLA